jgi:DNA-binding protein YbaB
MQISTVSLLLVLSAASAFAPVHTSTQHATQLNLFGGGNKAGSEKKGPGGGMMDQLAMFKKAQELATKKNKLDLELAEMDFEGTGADGKVKVDFKFVPIKNPMDPNPDYEAVSFEFDDEWYEGVSPEDLSAAVKEAIDSGIEATNKAAMEKYQSLQGDLMGAFQQMGSAEEEAPSS